jgi:hypothetical protein
MEQMINLIAIQVHVKHVKVSFFVVRVCQIIKGVSVHGAFGDEGFALMGTNYSKVDDCAVAVVAVLWQLDP